MLAHLQRASADLVHSKGGLETNMTNPFSPLDIPARQLYEDFIGHGYSHDEAVRLARRQSKLELPEDLYHAESWCESDWRYPKGEGAMIRHSLGRTPEDSSDER
jgi:hypothetical protein